MVALPQLSAGAHDLGTLGLFTWDEYLIATEIHGMVVRGDWRYNIPVYPAMYPFLGKVWVEVAGVGMGVSEANTILGLRLFSLAFTLLAIVAIYWTTYKLTKRHLWALMSALVTATCPTVLYWSCRVHPESLLLLELIGAFYFLAAAALQKRKHYLWLATCCAALAAATKMVGVFVLFPICMGAYLFNEKLVPWTAKAVALFTLVFAMASPPAVYGGRTFWGGLQRQMTGNWRGSGSTWDWPQIYIDVLGFAAGLGIAMALAVALGWLWRGSTGRPWQPKYLRNQKEWGVTLLFYFIAFFFTYLLLRVHIVVDRYLLPALPALLMLSALVGTSISPSSKRTLGLFLILVGISSTTHGWERGMAQIRLSEHKALHDGIATRDWLRENIPQNATVAFDRGSYVPQTKKLLPMSGPTLVYLDDHQPDYIITNRLHRDRFTREPAIQPSTRAQQDYKNRHNAYAAIESGELGYQPVKNFAVAGVVVYARNPKLSGPSHIE